VLLAITDDPQLVSTPGPPPPHTHSPPRRDSWVPSAGLRFRVCRLGRGFAGWVWWGWWNCLGLRGTASAWAV